MYFNHNDHTQKFLNSKACKDLDKWLSLPYNGLVFDKEYKDINNWKVIEITYRIVNGSIYPESSTKPDYTHINPYRA